MNPHYSEKWGWEGGEGVNLLIGRRLRFFFGGGAFFLYSLMSLNSVALQLKPLALFLVRREDSNVKATYTQNRYSFLSQE